MMQMQDLRVAAVQFESRPLNATRNLDRIEHFARQARAAGCHLVAFPECCISSYMPLARLSREKLAELAEPVPDGPSTERLLKIAADHELAVAAGLVESDEAGRLYNTYVVVTPEGWTHPFRKFHPFVSKHLSPGQRYVTFEYLGWRFGILICYDNNQPEHGRVLATRGVQVLLAPHQTGGFPIRWAGMGVIDRQLWDYREKAPDAIRAEFLGPKGREWLMRWLPSRAYDNGCYLIFSNGVGMDGREVRTGNTMIFDPHGRIITETAASRDDMVTAVLKEEPLEHNLGYAHMQTRRPELFGPLVEPVAASMSTKASRDAAIADGKKP
jgi:predicted amidohydrolase